MRGVSHEGLASSGRKACLGSQGKACHSQKGRLAQCLRKGLPGVSGKACHPQEGRPAFGLREGLPWVSEESLSFSKRKACLRSQGRLAWGLSGKFGVLRKEGVGSSAGVNIVQHST